MPQQSLQEIFGSSQKPSFSNGATQRKPLSEIFGGGSPSMSMPSQPTQSGGINPNILESAKQRFQNLGTKGGWASDSSVGDLLAGSTVKPILQGIGSGLATPVRAGQALYEGAKSLVTGQGLENAGQNLEKTFSEPVNVPWLGNLNLVKRDDQSGGINKFNTVASSVGTLGDALSGAYNIANPALGGFKGGLLRGGIQSASQAAKDEDATPESIALSGLIGGGIGGAFGGLGNQASKALNWFRDKRANLAGLSEDAINTLKNPNLGNQVLRNVQSAKSAMANPLEALNPLQKVGQEQFKPAINTLFQRNKVLGKQLGTVIENSGVKTNLGKVYDDFITTLEKFGGKIKNDPKKTADISPYSTFIDNVKVTSPKGKVSAQFGEFSPVDNAADIKEINGFLSILSKYRTKKAEASDLHDLIQKISAKLDYSNKTATPISGPTEAILKDLRSSASELLKSKVKGSSQLFDQMNNNYGIIDFFNPKLGENSSSAGVLKGLFSPQRKDELLPMLQSLQKATGSDILTPTKVAKTAMDIAGDTRGDSLLNIPNRPLDFLGKLLKNTITKPEGAAKGLVNQGQGLGIFGLPQFDFSNPYYQYTNPLMGLITGGGNVFNQRTKELEPEYFNASY